MIVRPLPARVCASTPRARVVLVYARNARNVRLVSPTSGRESRIQGEAAARDAATSAAVPGTVAPFGEERHQTPGAFRVYHAAREEHHAQGLALSRGQRVPHALPFRLQIADVMRVRLGAERHGLNDLQIEAFDTCLLRRVVRDQS